MQSFIRLLLITTVLLTTIITSCTATVSPTTTLEDPVQIESGLISGITTDDIHIYRGIPFAAPPIGNLRWKPPQPALPWQGVRQCTEFGPVPHQWAALGPPPTDSNEDCLYLNIWTPAKKQSDRLPVMVWLYGGGFRFGSSSTPLYDGMNLARHGVIVVTFNYRVGTLGFIAHPLLSKESEHNTSGNYGIHDQIAALQWVQKNIAAFGGDPNRVTIFGESAGAISVACLMASPLAKGLFQRAISQSLAELGPLAHVRESRNGIEPAESQGERLAKDLGCDTAADSIACMRSKSAEEIMSAGKPPTDYLSPGYRYGPIVDDWVLSDLPLNIFEAGKQHDVPYLLGSNVDEWALFQLRVTTTAESYQSYVNRTAGKYAQQVLAMYPATNDEQAKTSDKEVLTLYAFTCPAKAYASAMDKVLSRAYFYQFTRVPPGASQLGAFHALEIGYVFGNLMPILPTPDPEGYFNNDDRVLSEAMMNYWTQFATYGDPNQNELTRWPPYEAKESQYLELGDTIQVKSGLCDEACTLFQKIAGERRNK